MNESGLSLPSAAEASRQRDEEESRKQATIKREGPEGLKALQTKLDKAQEVNERDIPSEMLSCVPEPDLEEATTQLFDVQSFPGSTALTKSAEAWVSPGQQWALDHVDGTQFCRVDVCCDTRGLAPELRGVPTSTLRSFIAALPMTKMVSVGARTTTSPS